MAVQFFLNDNQTPIRVNTNATFIATKDDSDDTGTLTLGWNDSANAIAPRTKLRIHDLITGEDWNFIILKDNVSRVKKISPAKYVHILTVVQNTHEMTHYLLRPSTFQQPLQFRKAKTVAHGNIRVTATKPVPSVASYEFSTDGVLHLPNHHDGSTIVQNIYRADKVYISEREKVDKVQNSNALIRPSSAPTSLII